MNIKIDALHSANVRVSNADNRDRKFDVCGDLNVAGGFFSSISMGQVHTRDGRFLADFSVNAMPESPFSFAVRDPEMTMEEQMESMVEVHALVAECKARRLKVVMEDAGDSGE